MAITTVFENLFEKWKKNEEKIDKLKEEQCTLSKSINNAFGAIVKEQRLLTLLPWVFESKHMLTCLIRDSAVQAFLNKMEWDDSDSHWYHYTLKIGDISLYVNDGVMSLYFDSTEELVSFCDQHGIKPDLSELKDQHKRAETDMKEINQVIARFA